ncbi:MAG TPA: glycosyltransferase family 4 protein [Draconibacterium sp.]|jgi:polysaccharide biosynthesis protein PslH|nr:glycosyltransferase family 4 protein [Draconibacterium sp.]
MKILQITNKVPYPVKDGGAIACMNLARGFSLLGHQVTILAMNTVKHHITFGEIPESVKELAEFKLVNVPARISPVSALLNLFFSKKPYNATRFISKIFAEELKKILHENEYDIIQLEGLYVCPYIPVIRENSKAKIIYRAHNIEHEIWSRTAIMAHGFEKWYLKNLSKRIKRFETQILNKYDLLVPITSRDGNILNKLGNTKPAHVSQTGIDSSVLIPNSKNLNHPTLFHIGSLEWSPNQEGLIWFFENCWDAIREKYPDLKFYVAGRNAPPWFQKMLNLPNVVFKGEVADAYEFMNSKSIMVVPLFSGSGMRIKIIEGMALGKPIVTTPVGTEGISTTSGENIIVITDMEGFVKSISELIENRDFFDKISKNAIEFIHENFDNLSSAGALIEFYKKHIE